MNDIPAHLDAAYSIPYNLIAKLPSTCICTKTFCLWIFASKTNQFVVVWIAMVD